MPITSIIEDGISKKFNPVTKVKVNNADTGESTWIPEDSKTTHSLSVIKNGIYYAASEGYTAYDTVTVNVSSETEVNYEGIIADMPDLADLGLYDLDDLEGLDGLDLDLDELQNLENLILDGDLEEGEIPTSSPKIKGVDPVSGETLEVGLDEDGNLMEQALPDHIHIVVPPRKRKYQEGEIIDFSGIHVYLMDKSNHRYTSPDYPTGEIPFGELIFPMTVIDAGKGFGNMTASLDGTEVKTAYVVTWGHEIDVTGHPGARAEYTARGTDYIVANGYMLYAISKTDNFNSESFVFYTHESEPRGASSFIGITKSSYTINGVEKDYYHAHCGDTYFFDGNGSLPRTDLSLDEIAKILFEGDVTSENVEIPVEWMRSDGETLEDRYTITIVDSAEEVVPEPEPDPYADACDFIWEGKKYCFNKSLARCEVMYSNGNVWQTWLGGQSPPYTVDQALKLKLIVQVGWSGGGSTSGGF